MSTLSMVKGLITNGGFAHVFVVTAVTGEDERGRKEITAFLVDADTKGLILGKPEHKMGQCVLPILLRLL